MIECVKEFNVIYSQPSVEAFENLMNEFFKTFGMTETIDDMFCYGVFCKPQNYANFDFDIDEVDAPDFDIPVILLNDLATERERISYVEDTMRKIMCKEIIKPEWMKYVEMTACGAYGTSPSTFLYIQPKDVKYEKLGERLIEFLYSPNLTITMVRV